jgi:hypothetical protein
VSLFGVAFLLPLRTSHDAMSAYRDNVGTHASASLDSLMKVLLSVDVLQPQLSSLLLEAIPEYIDEDESHTYVFVVSECVCWLVRCAMRRYACV